MANHNPAPPKLDQDTLDAMWALFVHIGTFWQNVDLSDAVQYQSRLYSFMLNRIKINPLYRSYYVSTKDLLRTLIAERGEQEAYALLFTDHDCNQPPATTALELARQMVSNEFIALQLALGGFRAFGATNYPGYIGGANVSGRPPYRTYP